MHRLPLTLVTVLLAACIHYSHAAPANTLSPFMSCAALETYYKKEAIHRVGPTGLSATCRNFYSSDDAAESDGRSYSAPRRRSGGGGGGDFSETNVQVDGVDEPDMIKTDGSRVFVVRDRNLSIVQANATRSSGTVTGTLKLPTSATDMLFHDNHLLVLSETYEQLMRTGDLIARPWLYSGEPITLVYQVRVTGPTPVLVSSLRIQGRYVSAREVNGVVRLALSFNPENSINFTSPRGKITQRMATDLNIAILANTTADDWLPRFIVKSYTCADGARNCNTLPTAKSTGRLVGCRNVYTPRVEFAGFELLSVVTLRIAGELAPRKSVAITATADNLYATATSLYVTTTEFQGDFYDAEDGVRSGANFTTSFHKFALSASRGRYVASGSVMGSVLNQFSMHEYGGVFFVATTKGARWWSNRDSSKSKVTAYVTHERTRKLREVGSVGDLGLGERIYSVRYLADTVYVVTFREVDPLYIIDLSDPRDLKVTGELKLPGFSTYLHPIAPGRLLGVGQDATPKGRTTGAKATLFDVSDKSKPKELSSWTLKGSSSNAEWDHRAFLYWQPEGIAVLPLSVYARKEKNRFTGAVVLKVSGDTVVVRGRITHKLCCGNKYKSSIKRNLVLGGKFIWSLSSDQLQVNNMRNLVVKSNIVLKSK